MRQRTSARLPDRATIKRPAESNATGVEAYEGTAGGPTTVADDVPCRFDDESTSFVREDSGERVQRPASITFRHSVDIREGDKIDVEGVSTTWEVRGINDVRDGRRGRTVRTECELERIN